MEIIIEIRRYFCATPLGPWRWKRLEFFNSFWLDKGGQSVQFFLSAVPLVYFFPIFFSLTGGILVAEDLVSGDDIASLFGVSPPRGVPSRGSSF